MNKYKGYFQRVEDIDCCGQKRLGQGRSSFKDTRFRSGKLPDNQATTTRLGLGEQLGTWMPLKILGKTWFAGLQSLEFLHPAPLVLLVSLEPAGSAVLPLVVISWVVLAFA